MERCACDLQFSLRHNLPTSLKGFPIFGAALSSQPYAVGLKSDFDGKRLKKSGGLVAAALQARGSMAVNGSQAGKLQVRSSSHRCGDDIRGGLPGSPGDHASSHDVPRGAPCGARAGAPDA
jgi:hypothetical protein